MYGGTNFSGYEDRRDLWSAGVGLNQMLGHTTRRGSLSYRSFQRTGFRSPCEPACCASMLGRWDQGEVRCQEGRFDITTDYPVATSPRFCISKTLEWETNY